MKRLKKLDLIFCSIVVEECGYVNNILIQINTVKVE
jgi:hypothetical protein